jgi:hypothetical protein
MMRPLGFIQVRKVAPGFNVKLRGFTGRKVNIGSVRQSLSDITERKVKQERGPE